MITVKCPECNEDHLIEEDGEVIECPCGAVLEVSIMVINTQPFNDDMV